MEGKSFAKRDEIANALMIRKFVNHELLAPRSFKGFAPGDGEEETMAFNHIFYGPPQALIARGSLLATLHITIVWADDRKINYSIDIYESISLLRVAILINLCHALYGIRIRDCNIWINNKLLGKEEKFGFKERLKHGDHITINPIGQGLYGGSQKNAVTPPLGENDSKAAPAASELKEEDKKEEALPTYQEATAVVFNDASVANHDIQPDNNQPMDDDDDDVYDDSEAEEEEEEKLSIAEQINLTQRELNSKKRKLELLDARFEQEERDARFALHRVNLYQAQQALLPIIREFPMYLTLLHTRALQIQYIAYTIEGYLSNPIEETPIDFQNQHLSSMLSRLQQIDDNDEVDNLIKLALAFTISPDD